MGIDIAGWQKKIIDSLAARGISVQPFSSGSFSLLSFEGKPQLVIHLINIDNNFSADDLLMLENKCRSSAIQLIQLWEDIWLKRPEQVLGRICSMLGINRKIHGRKTKAESISQQQADEFLNQYHLQGSAKARHKYGLLAEGKIVAVATFSAKRKMTRRQKAGYTSVELIRFATLDGFTVQGGMSKLIGHMIEMVRPNDVMTYADLDWSYGKGYVKLGFHLDDQLPPSVIYLDCTSYSRYFLHRLPEEMIRILSGLQEKERDTYLKSLHYNRIFNTGNLKYILYL